MVAEILGEFQKLLGVAGEPRQFGKDDAGDMATFDVSKPKPKRQEVITNLVSKVTA
jgi:hypothetical protein